MSISADKVRTFCSNPRFVIYAKEDMMVARAEGGIRIQGTVRGELSLSYEASSDTYELKLAGVNTEVLAKGAEEPVFLALLVLYK